VYDARENFAGVPEANRRLTSATTRCWRPNAWAPRAAVLTVSAPIAEAIDGRLALPRPPVVVLNAPVLRTAVLREACVPTVVSAGPSADRLRRRHSGRAGPGSGRRSAGAAGRRHAALIVVPYPNPVPPN
jgi:hypothetical protein